MPSQRSWDSGWCADSSQPLPWSNLGYCITLEPHNCSFSIKPCLTYLTIPKWGSKVLSHSQLLILLLLLLPRFSSNPHLPQCVGIFGIHAIAAGPCGTVSSIRSIRAESQELIGLTWAQSMISLPWSCWCRAGPAGSAGYPSHNGNPSNAYVNPCEWIDDHPLICIYIYIHIYIYVYMYIYI